MLCDITHCLGRILGLTSVWLLLSGPVCCFAFRLRTARTSPAGAGFDVYDALSILPEDPRSKPPTPVHIDLDKAQDLARNFGKYSFVEVEHMRDDLHAHRFLNDSPNDVLFLERVLEDELTSQLESLKEQMPDPYLFRYDDTPSVGLFSTNGNEESDKRSSSSNIVIDFPHINGLGKVENQLLMEGIVEPLIICFVLGLLITVPQQPLF